MNPVEECDKPPEINYHNGDGICKCEGLYYGIDTQRRVIDIYNTSKATPGEIEAIRLEALKTFELDRVHHYGEGGPRFNVPSLPVDIVGCPK
jgi:hypothetical protein